MKILIQRTANAAVHVNGECTGAIDRGLLLFVGIDKHDDSQTLEKMANKVLGYRVFPDSDEKMNLNIADIDGGLLVVSQFTLSADTRKGLRPSFSAAAPPAIAEVLFNQFVDQLREKHTKIETGVFGADMKVSLLNDGPVTFLLES